MKKVFFILLSVLMLFLLVSCEKSDEKDGIKVAMITSQGGLGDKSWNDSGYQGLVKAKEGMNIETKVIEPKDAAEGEKFLNDLAQAGYDLIITMEYAHGDVLKEVAPKYKDTHFAIFNQVVDVPNVVSVVFGEHEGSFLAGALAALMTTDTSIPRINSDKKIGFIGGIQSPGIDKFLVGYREGAKYIDKDIQVVVGYANSFGDPNKGKEIASSQINNGVDIIYSVAGGTGIGVFEEAENKNVYAIGVDTDQDYLKPGTILTSMLKRVDLSIYEMIKQLVDGNLQNNTVMTPALAQKGVSLTEMKYTKDDIPAKYLERLEEIKQDIINNKIKVTDITAK
ncbi:BMP family ABC transporter substrate-binding protein [Oceanotoga sp. DSM 15011]|uniref:BMP family lipoprotein n=1 Tax=Oceanotoga sp. DSM 15011 TaxID=2984951 RepID=UPI0021F45621|nr:BMP family ABC transporter substrate-binding protein [Oceanotoga sp. DSM 15011]UYP01241.1 BMP family ABC transporter substrate-binding protein [Oceanotoga sp. DSM 15011]